MFRRAERVLIRCVRIGASRMQSVSFEDKVRSGKPEIEGTNFRAYRRLIFGDSRHMLRAHCWTCSPSAKVIGHLRTSQTFLLPRETDDVVAINPFSACSNCTSVQNAFTVSMPITSFVRLH